MGSQRQRRRPEARTSEPVTATGIWLALYTCTRTRWLKILFAASGCRTKRVGFSLEKKTPSLPPPLRVGFDCRNSRRWSPGMKRLVSVSNLTVRRLIPIPPTNGTCGTQFNDRTRSGLMSSDRSARDATPICRCGLQGSLVPTFNPNTNFSRTRAGRVNCTRNTEQGHD